MPEIVNAAPGDRDRASAALLTAFVSDPLLRWMLPDPTQYLAYFPQLMAPFGGSAFDHNSAYRSDDYVAAALWLPPGVHPDEEALGALLQAGVHSALQEEVFAFMGQVDASHPQIDHWYLPVIGVDPSRQGMGYGSALLARSLEACDATHLPAYLESSNPRNVPLYERFGFEVIGALQAGSSPTIVPMLRAAR